MIKACFHEQPVQSAKTIEIAARVAEIMELRKLAHALEQESTCCRHLAIEIHEPFYLPLWTTSYHRTSMLSYSTRRQSEKPVDESGSEVDREISIIL